MEGSNTMLAAPAPLMSRVGEENFGDFSLGEVGGFFFVIYGVWRPVTTTASLTMAANHHHRYAWPIWCCHARRSSERLRPSVAEMARRAAARYPLPI